MRNAQFRADFSSTRNDRKEAKMKQKADGLCNPSAQNILSRAPSAETVPSSGAMIICSFHKAVCFARIIQGRSSLRVNSSFIVFRVTRGAYKPCFPIYRQGRSKPIGIPSSTDPMVSPPFLSSDAVSQAHGNLLCPSFGVLESASRGLPFAALRIGSASFLNVFP